MGVFLCSVALSIVLSVRGSIYKSTTLAKEHEQVKATFQHFPF